MSLKEKYKAISQNDHVVRVARAREMNFVVNEKPLSEEELTENFEQILSMVNFRFLKVDLRQS